jgi:hypothetical protein
MNIKGYSGGLKGIFRKSIIALKYNFINSIKRKQLDYNLKLKKRSRRKTFNYSLRHSSK